MIKVVLADDEPLIIKGLRKLIRWEELGLEIVGQAGDGKELLELVEREVPQIVISDISMPHMSGIDIIKYIQTSGLPAKVIFISAYQEFSYARDAVAFGAVDYLVKPIVKEQLEDVLIRTAALISEQTEEEIRKSKLRMLERKVKQDELQEWLGRLSDGTLPVSSEAFGLLERELRQPPFFLGIIEANPVSKEGNRWTEEESKLVEFPIGNILQELIVNPGAGCLFLKNNRHTFVTQGLQAEEALDLAYEIKEKIGTYLKLGVTIGLSREAGGCGLLTLAFQEAEQALNSGFFIGRNRIIPYAPRTSGRPLGKELFVFQKEVVDGLLANRWEEVERPLNQLLDAIYQIAYGNRELAVSTALSSVLFVIQELMKSDVGLSREMNMHALQQRLGQIQTFGELREEVAGSVKPIFQTLGSALGNKEKLLMLKVLKYIEEHCQDELTLESVAAMMYMNPSYFSFFFKKHAGQNFKQHVTEMRMKQAVKLLLHTDMMVYEIAERVGYNNPRYFSDTFKKIYGLLPNEFRHARKRSE